MFRIPHSPGSSIFSFSLRRFDWNASWLTILEHATSLSSCDTLPWDIDPQRSDTDCGSYSLPTVIALAFYFCLADAILITQCLYYKYVKPSDKNFTTPAAASDDPNQPLLPHKDGDIGLPGSRRRSSGSQRRRTSGFEAANLPVVQYDGSAGKSWTRTIFSLLSVCLIGAVGWAVSWKMGLWYA